MENRNLQENLDKSSREDLAPVIRIAHLSDLHIGFLSRHPRDWLSKALIAQLNYLLNFHRRFNMAILQLLPELLTSLQVSHVLISGDFTTAGSECEFKYARAFLEKLLNKGLKLFLVPGNHDHYTKRDQTSGFYRYLYPLMQYAEGDLFDQRFEQFVLGEEKGNLWNIWLLDQAVPTSWMSSQGHFSSQSSWALSSAMQKKSSSQINNIVCGHFPLHNSLRRSRDLIGRKTLRQILCKQNNVRLYAHGHTHQFHLFDERPKRQALCADTGSTTQQTRAGFNLYELAPKKAKLQRYILNGTIVHPQWVEGAVYTWAWT